MYLFRRTIDDIPTAKGWTAAKKKYEQRFIDILLKKYLLPC